MHDKTTRLSNEREKRICENRKHMSLEGKLVEGLLLTSYLTRVIFNIRKHYRNVKTTRDTATLRKEIFLDKHILCLAGVLPICNDKQGMCIYGYR